MPLPHPGRITLRRGGDGSVRISGEPDRSPHVVRATTALAQLKRLAEAPEAEPIDVQLVVQVSDAAGYARWRDARERTWRAEGGSFTTSGWPRRLPEGSRAAVLLPLPYGASTTAGAKTPRVIADPLFSTRPTDDGSTADDVALGLVAEWLRQAGTGTRPLRPAPPLLHDGTSERRVLDLGLIWPLPAASA
ncbi:hypothetical protein [Conexibacter woesei]|uniref:hypothetical protein n=1 Tax=Conexibacter woesei TaxID=191495 RepID=UPI0003F7DCE0|nr:hypothetical protein [Conexibacter woesei]